MPHLSDSLFCPVRVLFVQLCLVSMLPAGLAQEVAQPSPPHRSLPQNGVPLEEVLLQLEKTYRVNFAYDEQIVHGQHLDPQPVADGQAAPPDLEDLLDQLLTPLSLAYRRIGRVYVIQGANSLTRPPFDTAARVRVPPPTAGWSSRNGSKQQITGRVTDLATDEGLPGVNVIIRGTTLGTVTDVEGYYHLAVPPDTEALVFSMVGYVREEVVIGHRAMVNFAMVPDIYSLDEVVVIGYDTQKKSDVTGAVASVKLRAIQQRPVPSLDQALQGQAAGVYTNRTSGAPGAGARTFIRGVSSIQGADPLWIIDGVRTTPGPNFDMNDVASVEILKDASAAAVYGSAAANGVVIVTTQRGEEGRATVNLNAYAGVSAPLGLPDPLSTSQYALLKNEAYDLAGDERIPAYANPGRLPPVSTDWLDVLYGPAPLQNYHLSVSGGSPTSTYFISGGIL